MNENLIQRYQPGGDVYAGLARIYSTATADAAANAAKTGSEIAINNAIANSGYGAKLDTSIISNFANQIETNPFGAPLESLATIADNTFKTIGGGAVNVVKGTANVGLWIGVGIVALVALLLFRK